MGWMVSKVLRMSHEQGSELGKVYVHWCPGCRQAHAINVEKPNPWNAVWSFDGNVDRPTFSPSVNIVGRCHYFIRNGNIEFCSDSKHALSGQTVPLPEWPSEFEWYGDGTAK